jgi:hypothetical protein
MGYPPAPQQRPMPMPVHPHMRAASVDRERGVDVLKAAFAEGRLNQDEYNDRMGKAYNARTYGELVALTGDLPAGPLPVAMPQAWQQAWQAPPVQRTNSMATAALVMGLLEFFTMGLTAIPAIICGHIARGQIKRTAEQGDGMAVAGLVLGYLAIAFGVLIAIIAVVAIAHSGPGSGPVIGQPISGP